jgi:hypothetical protein
MAGATKHKTKLSIGQGLATITASVSFWGDIPAPNTAEAGALEQQFQTAQQIALDNAPGEAHAARMDALYVDLSPDELWKRPKETGPSDAYLMVSKASIEYGVRRGKFVHPINAIVAQAVEQLGVLVPKLPDAPDVHWPHE